MRRSGWSYSPNQDDRHLWIDGAPVRSFALYQNTVRLTTATTEFWFWRDDYWRAASRPGAAFITPLSQAEADAERNAHPLPLYEWTA
jgi:hypothetical protein